MPTGIGLVFFLLGLYYFFRKWEYLFPLLLFSAIFPATSAITFGSLWIMPYYLIAPLFILSQLLRGGITRRFRGSALLVGFTGLAVFSAIAFPFVFGGEQVYSPRLGSSDAVFQTFPLVFSVANIAQAAYIIINMLVVFAAASVLKTDKVWKGVNAAYYTMLGVIVCEATCFLLGIRFPYNILENNPDRASVGLRLLDLTARVHGTAGEPSYTGLVLITFFAAYLYRSYTSGKDGWKAILSAVMLVLVRSSSSLLTLGIVTALVILSNLPLRVSSSNSGSAIRMRQFLRFAFVCFLIGISFTSSTLRGIVDEFVFEKSETGSYEHRTTMDKYSLTLLVDTYGIGVGLGSYRPSSLIASLLGNMGLLGLLLFALVYLAIARSITSDQVWLRWALLASLIDMAIAIPDITEPFLWVLTALVVYVTVPRPALIQPMTSRPVRGVFTPVRSPLNSAI